MFQHITSNLFYLICTYASPIKYTLRTDREPMTRIMFLSANPSATKYMLDNKDSINWQLFSSNPSDEAVCYLIRNPEYIRWKTFILNENPLVHSYLSSNYTVVGEKKYNTSVESILSYEEQCTWENKWYESKDPLVIEKGIELYQNEFMSWDEEKQMTIFCALSKQPCFFSEQIDDSGYRDLLSNLYSHEVIPK